MPTPQKKKDPDIDEDRPWDSPILKPKPTPAPRPSPKTTPPSGANPTGQVSDEALAVAEKLKKRNKGIVAMLRAVGLAE